MARRARPVTFVDVVDAGSTFAELFDLLNDWIVEVREPWDVVRRKLRFVGVTMRRQTKPEDLAMAAARRLDPAASGGGGGQRFP